MRTIVPCTLMLLAASGLAGEPASLLLLGNDEPQRVFGEGERPISATFQNAGDEPVDADINLRLQQTTFATAALISENPWKTLKVLPGQTVLESAEVQFPQVRAETKFAVQWIEGTNRVVGVTPVLVYPTNLLQELSALVGEEGTLGIFDPADQFKPALDDLGIEFQDLEDSGVANFRGRLAIVGPFESKVQMPPELGLNIQAAATKGAGVVWIQPPPGSRDPIKPSFYLVPEGKGQVVVVQADLVARPADSPQSQLNLIHFCRLAVQPEPLSLPHLSAQP